MVDAIDNELFSSAAMQAYLLVREPHRWLDVIPLAPETPVSIGRDPVNRVMIADSSASRMHAEIYFSENRWRLRDLGSLNGTLVNSVKIGAEHSLVPGEAILIGGTQLFFVDDPRAMPAPTGPPSVDFEVLDEDEGRFNATATIVLRQGQSRFHSKEKETASVTLKADHSATRLCRLAFEIARSPNRDALAQLALRGMLEGTGADCGAVLLSDQEASEAGEPKLTAMAWQGHAPMGYQAISPSLATVVLRDGDAILARMVNNDSQIANRDEQGKIHAQSMIAAPIRVGEETLGLVHLYTTVPDREFTRDHVDFCLAVAQTMGVAMHTLTALAQAEVDRKNAEEFMRKNADRLAEADKLRAVAQLAGGVAHNFNNQLQTILGYTNLAQDGLPAEDRRFQDLEQVKQAAQSAASLTRQLSSFGQIQVLEPVDVDLNQMIAGSLRVLAANVGDSCRLEFAKGEDLWNVKADRTLLEQVLLNLGVHACEASAGGVLRLATANVSLEDCEAAYPSAPAGRYVLLSLAYEGPQIAQEALDRIFEPFYSAAGMARSKGLGLAMVYGIVKQHSGHIRATSSPTGGATISILLPAVERASRKTARVFAQAAPGGDEMILVADDEPAVLELASRVLTSAGYRVITATNGTEALAAIDQHRSEIRAIVLDVVMPGMGGLSAFERIRMLDDKVPVLFITGFSPEMLSGSIAEQVLVKPFAPESLLCKIRESLDRVAESAPQD